MSYYGSLLNFWNRENFRLVVQHFKTSEDGVAFTIRRRDGVTTDYWLVAGVHSVMQRTPDGHPGKCELFEQASVLRHVPCLEHVKVVISEQENHRTLVAEHVRQVCPQDLHDPVCSPHRVRFPLIIHPFRRPGIVHEPRSDHDLPCNGRIALAPRSLEDFRNRRAERY